MAKDKKSLIVVKKITIGGAGAHGGSWKVAFADFMTAMMCFFLVMWLLNADDATKKAIAQYFSGPSVIEHQLSSYGAELTVEKIFLDFFGEYCAHDRLCRGRDLHPQGVSPTRF